MGEQTLRLIYSYERALNMNEALFYFVLYDFALEEIHPPCA